MKNIPDLIQEHPFFADLPREEIEEVAGCARNVVIEEGTVIGQKGEQCNQFYLLRKGKVSLAIDVPPRPPFIFETLSEGEILGLSWLTPPYTWTITATAMEQTHAVLIEAMCLRGKCEVNHTLGYMLMQRLTQLLLQRQEALRLHVLDVYG